MRLSSFVLPALVGLCACSALEPQAAPPTVTLVPAVTATPLPSKTPAATVTPLPSATTTPAPSKTPMPSATPARSGLIDAVRSVNLRAGPGISYAPLAALQPGDQVTLLAQDAGAGWHQVRLADGREGWVAASLIAETESPAADGALPVIDVESIRALATALVGEADATATPAADSAAPAAAATAGTATTGSTARTGVDVLAYCDDLEHGFPPPAKLMAGSTIDIWWNWYARTEAQIRAHLANAIYRVTVDGEPLGDFDAYRLPLRRQDDDNVHVDWYVRYGPLEAGEHRITYELTWRAAISDGYRRFGPDTETPQESGSCTFRVLPAGP